MGPNRLQIHIWIDFYLTYHLLLQKISLFTIPSAVKLGDKEQIGAKEPFLVTKCQFTS